MQLAVLFSYCHSTISHTNKVKKKREEVQIVDRGVKIQGQFVVYGEHIFLNTLSKGPVDKAESATVETVSSVHIFFF